MPRQKKTDECKCGLLERMAEEPGEPVKFDRQLNEYQIQRQGDGGYSVIRFCPFCGGQAPKSKRSSLFQQLTAAERQRLTELTRNLQTVQDVIAALGEPDVKGLTLAITKPEKEGMPETTQNYPLMTYTRVSDMANVNVQVYPTDRVAITFQAKPMLVQQKHEIQMFPGPKPPDPGPQIDTRKRYDVYCIEPNREVVLYRNALFKGAVALLPHPAGRIYHHDYVELEQANGQSIFIPRSSIFRFCEPGTTFVGEVVDIKKPRRGKQRSA